MEPTSESRNSRRAMNAQVFPAPNHLLHILQKDSGVSDVAGARSDARGRNLAQIAREGISIVNSKARGGKCWSRTGESHFDGWQGLTDVPGCLRYLQELQRAASGTGGQKDGGEGQSLEPSGEYASLQSQLTPESMPTPNTGTEPSNPLASAKSSYVSDDKGRLRWLGESSTWSFSRKTLMLIRDHLKESNLPNFEINGESRAYDLNWGNVPFDEAAKFGGLPPIDDATYLIESLKFHVGKLFHLFDEKEFTHHIKRFYKNPAQHAKENRIWYVQFLVILALAKAVTSNPVKGSRTLPGSRLFTQAMSLMPDSSYLFNDAMTAIEMLCVIALYLQSADMRNPAYVYTGQAMRMSLIFGLHRERPKDGIWSPETADRCQKIWWTVYVLERNFASTMGVPMTIHDEDITTPMPDTDKDTSLYVHVRISGLIFHVIRKVYGVEGRLQASFLPSVKEVLARTASIARDLNKWFPLPKEGSSEIISRVSAHLHLLYHQAVLLTMYPLLLFLVQARLREGKRDIRETRTLSETPRALLKSCAESCNSMIHILGSLRKEGLLESFLPFDLERIFSAAFVIKMLRFVMPRLQNYRQLRSESGLLLDDLVQRGNIPASFRKSELESLEAMMRIWSKGKPKDDQEGDGAPEIEINQETPPEQTGEMPADGLGFDFGEFENGFMDTNIMSPGQLLSLVEMVDVQEGPVDCDMTWMDAWLWENTEEQPAV